VETPLRTLRCSHTFCDRCLEGWWRTANANSCPNCRVRRDKGYVLILALPFCTVIFCPYGDSPYRRERERGERNEKCRPFLVEACYSGLRHSRRLTVEEWTTERAEDGAGEDNDDGEGEATLAVSGQGQQDLFSAGAPGEGGGEGAPGEGGGEGALEEVVERIVEARRTAGGARQYRVRWQGYGPADDTGEPRGHVEGCARLVEFEAGRREGEAGGSEGDVGEGCGEGGAVPAAVACDEDGAMWEAHLAKLEDYRAAHGDCRVPQRWAEDPRLGSWVGMQRKLKRKLDRGEATDGMTAARAARLTALGLAGAGPTARPNYAIDHSAPRGRTVSHVRPRGAE
jgi:hypothetical protein